MKRKIIPPIPERENYGSYLRKRKGSNFNRIFGDTNTRWFYIEYYNEFFGYKNKEKDNKIKGLHKFTEIKGIKDFKDSASKSITKEWKYGLEVDLIDKKYFLFAQTEEIQQKWIYEFKIILRLLPQSFPMIERIIFQLALDLYQKPYLDNLKKETEEKELKLKQEKEEKTKKRKEERENKKKEEQDRQLQKEKEDEEEKFRIENENKRKTLELFLFNKTKNNSVLDKKLSNLFDESFESLIADTKDKLIENNENSFTKNENKNGSISLNSNLDYGSNLIFKDDLDDWDFYNEDNEKVLDKELDKNYSIKSVINANKTPQIENVNFIKSSKINQKLQIELDLNKKSKNEISKKFLTNSDPVRINPLMESNENENKSTLFTKNTIDMYSNVLLNTVKENKEEEEFSIKNQKNFELKKSNNHQGKAHTVLNGDLFIENNISRTENSNITDNNIELDLSMNSRQKYKTCTGKKKNYNFENSMNYSNNASLIYLTDNDQVPGISLNQQNHQINPEEAKQKKIKKPKNFKKLTEYKSKDKAKKLLDFHINENPYNTVQLNLNYQGLDHFTNINKKYQLNSSKVSGNLNNSKNQMIFQEDDLFAKQPDFTDSNSKKNEYGRSYTGFDLSQDWNFDELDDDLNDDFHKNIELVKKNDEENKIKIRYMQNESQSDNLSENVYRSYAQNESTNKINVNTDQSYNSNNFSRGIFNSMNFGSEINSNNNENSNLEEKIVNHIETKTNNMKKYKKIYFPGIDYLRNERNENKINSLIIEDVKALNTSAFSNYSKKIINENPENDNFKTLNQSTDEEKLNNFSNNKSQFLEQTPIIKKKNNLFNLKDDFDFEMKEEDKARDLKKIIETATDDSNNIYQNYFKNKDSCQLNRNEFKFIKEKNIFNHSLNYGINNKIENDKFNDKEYENIYDKTNRSDYNSDLSISDLAHGNLNNRMSDNFAIQNNQENLNSQEEKLNNSLNERSKFLNRYFKENSNSNKINDFPKSDSIHEINENCLINSCSDEIKNEMIENMNKFTINKQQKEPNNRDISDLYKNNFEVDKFKIFKNPYSEIKIEENKIFDEDDDFEKILSKPIIFDKKTKDKISNPLDSFKNKSDVNIENMFKTKLKDESILNINLNEIVKKDGISENLEDLRKAEPLGKDDAIILIDSRIKTDQPKNSGDDLINIQRFETSFESYNDVYNFSFHRSENVSLIIENNFTQNFKNNELGDDNKVSTNDFNSPIIPSKDIEENVLLSKEDTNYIISNDSKAGQNSKDPDEHVSNRDHFNYDKSQNNIEKYDDYVNENIEFDNFSLGKNKIKKTESEILDKIIESPIQCIDYQKAKLKNTIFWKKNKNENSNLISIQSVNGNQKISSGVFRDDLIEDW